MILKSRLWPLAAMLVGIWLAPRPLLADDSPLHVRIDALIRQQSDRPFAPSCSDEAFIRRVTLDLAGRIPTPDELRAFENDPSEDKRASLIDQLLAGGDHPRRLREALHVMWMERRGDDEHWTRFLQAACESNLPYDQLVRHLLCPDPDDDQMRGAAFFITKRLEKYGQNPVDLPGLTRDVGRLLLGVDLQCAQCHDHLFIDDYKQADFQGLFAFVSHTFIRRDTEFPSVGEKPIKAKVDFMSVFVQEPLATGPRLPGGKELEIPIFKAGEEFEIAPDRKTKHPGLPKFRPLKILAEQLPRGDNRLFARNAANRLWFLMMGRGLVHPLDLDHSDNPPSHPELLDLLADELVAHKFDLRWMLRQLALTSTYQRSTRLPNETAAEQATAVSSKPVSPPAESSYRVALEKPLSAEQLLVSTLIATGHMKLADLAREPTDAAAEEDSKQLAELRSRFVAAIANVPREPEVEFNPSVKAALFLMHDPEVQELFRSESASLPARLADPAAKKTDAEIALTLYQAALTRKPTAAEVQEVSEALSQHADHRAETIGHLLWALVASAEFALNH